jgi:hypothetical protein
MFYLDISDISVEYQQVIFTKIILAEVTVLDVHQLLRLLILCLENVLEETEGSGCQLDKNSQENSPER